MRFDEMHPEHRLRIIAYLVEIGKQLNDLPEENLSQSTTDGCFTSGG